MEALNDLSPSKTYSFHWLKMVLLCCLLLTAVGTGIALQIPATKAASSSATQGKKPPVPPTKNAFLYVAGTDSISKIRAKDGTIVWSSPAPDELQTTGAPFLVGEHEVLMSSDPAVVTALDKETGKQLWQKKMGPEQAVVSIDAFLTVQHDTLYLETTQDTTEGYNYHLLAVNTRTGEERWNYAYATQLGQYSVLATDGGFQIYKNVVVFGTPDGHIHALQQDNGSLLWESVVAQPEGTTTQGMSLQPVARDLYVSVTFMESTTLAYSSTVLKVQTDNGHVIWKQDAKGSSALFSYHPQAGLVFARYPGFGSGALSIVSLDPNTGTTRWESHAVDGVILQLIPTNTLIYTRVMMSASVYALDSRTGALAWQSRPDPTENQTGATSSLVVGHGQVFGHASTRASRINEFFALGIDGTPAWTHDYGSTNFAQWLNPVLSGNEVYGGTYNTEAKQTSLYAFAQKNGAVKWQITLPEVALALTLDEVVNTAA